MVRRHLSLIELKASTVYGVFAKLKHVVRIERSSCSEIEDWVDQTLSGDEYAYISPVHIFESGGDIPVGIRHFEVLFPTAELADKCATQLSGVKIDHPYGNVLTQE